MPAAKPTRSLTAYDARRLGGISEGSRSGDRSQRIRTYNFPQNRVTDHRINLDLYKLDLIMQGELDEVIAALKLHDRQKRLQNLVRLDAPLLAEPAHPDRGRTH